MTQFPLGNRKQVPARTLVFGATGHLGGPVAQTLQAIAPDMALRLVSTRAEGADQLRNQFKTAEVVVADLFDLESLKPALEGVEGLWIVTPDFTDEHRAMGNLVKAANEYAGITHAVRMAGDVPGIVPARMSDFVQKFGDHGPAMQHHVAADILQANLPTTIVNSVYLFDNFTRFFLGPILESKKLVLPFNIRMGFIDAADIGIFAAHLLASDDHRHIGQKYNMDNGHDVMRFSDVMSMLAEITGEPFHFVADPDLFARTTGAQMNEMIGTPDAARYFTENWWMEHENDVVFRKSDIFNFVTGLKAKRLRPWLEERKDVFLGKAAPF